MRKSNHETKCSCMMPKPGFAGQNLGAFYHYGESIQIERRLTRQVPEPFVLRQMKVLPKWFVLRQMKALPKWLSFVINSVTEVYCLSPSVQRRCCACRSCLRSAAGLRAP